MKQGTRRLILPMLCVLVSAGFGSCGPVVRPEPPKVVIPPMPERPTPQGVRTVQDELLEPLPPTRPR